jgi:hypothetical protein
LLRELGHTDGTIAELGHTDGTIAELGHTDGTIAELGHTGAEVCNHPVVVEAITAMDRAQLIDLDYVIRQIRHNFRELFKL